MDSGDLAAIARLDGMGRATRVLNAAPSSITQKVQRLEELVAHRDIVGLRRLEFGALEAILGAVSADLGVTLMLAVLVDTTWRGGRIAAHFLPTAEAQVQATSVRRRDMASSSALVAFLNHVAGR